MTDDFFRKLRNLLAAADTATGPDARAAVLTSAVDADPDLRAGLASLAGTREMENPTPLLATPRIDSLPMAGPAAPPEAAGDRIGGYRLVRPLGEGGMGAVWLADQLEPVRRPVAVKLVKAGMDSPAVLARFDAERQALAVMDHPSIAKVFDAGLTPAGRPYFVMELVQGVPITRYCDDKRLTPRERLALFVSVCQAVQHAHQKGVIHRDLKPSNVLVAEYDGRPVPKVIDFGIAKATGDPLAAGAYETKIGSVVGTLEYMAPEQAGGNPHDVDTRADVYALGVVLYELLTGTTPLDARRLIDATVFELLKLVREQEPPVPSARLSTSDTLPSIAANRQTEPARLTRLVRGELDWVVMRALDKDRTRRYQTANGLALDVQRYLADEPVEAGPPSWRYRAGKFARRHRGPVAVAAAFVMLLAAAAAVSAWLAVRATDARGVAEQKTQDAETARGKAEQAADDALAVRSLLVDILQQGSSAGRAAAGNAVRGGLTVKEAIDYTARTVGERFKDRPRVEGEVRDHLGTMYFNLGAFPEAADQLAKAVAVRERALGPDAEETLKSRNNLGVAYRALKRFDDAERELLAVLAAKRRTLGDAHRSTLATVNNLGNLYLEQKRFDLAERYFDDALAGRRAHLGETDPDTLTSLNNVASVRFQTKRHADALPLYEAAADGFVKRFTRDSPRTLQVLKNLAMCHARLGQREAAERLLLEVVERAAALQPSERRVLLPETATELVALYDGWNRPADAATWRERLKEYLPREAAPPPRAGKG